VRPPGHRTRPGALVGAPVLALTAVASLVLGACGSTAESSPEVVPRSGTIAVQALDNRFEAKEITITAGSTVTWTNDGVNVHDVVPAEGTDFGVKPIDFKPDATYSTTFATPGSYAYYCSLHGSATKGMTGTVIVVAP
jgi:plastocyanin